MSGSDASMRRTDSATMAWSSISSTVTGRSGRAGGCAVVMGTSRRIWSAARIAALFLSHLEAGAPPSKKRYQSGDPRRTPNRGLFFTPAAPRDRLTGHVDPRRPRDVRQARYALVLP